jgi:hypothetical protein
VNCVLGPQSQIDPSAHTDTNDPREHLLYDHENEDLGLSDDNGWLDNDDDCDDSDDEVFGTYYL